MTERVYFIQALIGGPIKIGRSGDVLARLTELQLSSPVRLRVVGEIHGGAALERELHLRFARWRLHGEWFSERADGLAELVESNSRVRSLPLPRRSARLWPADPADLSALHACQLAELVRVSERTILRLWRSGELRGDVGPDGEPRFSWDDILAKRTADAA